MRFVPVLAPPTQLGKYEVGAKIGGGGMATVYIGRALRDDGTEERVALKVIRDELAHDEQFKRMFIDEAKILARLSHPNVIQTLEYGLTGHHRFIAMELLSGRTYADVWEHLVQEGERLPDLLSAWICARVAEGLHSAHELLDETGQPLGVIHRDVNPGNVFLTHSGDVKLIDFGLAKARVRLSKSEDGIVKGKIPYLAPEQAHGRPIDRRIDVYALGATLWESVTMKRLFKRDNDVETLRAIREAKVPDVRTLVEGFPDELWRIIARALEQDPDKRYPSSEALGAELDAFVGARRPAMKGELAALLTRLFPGQEARQARWERAATSVHLPMATMPPPAPVPTASSSMLEVEADAEPDQVVPKVEVVAAQADVEAEAASEREAIRVETSAERPAPPPAEASARTGKKKKKKKHGNGPKKGRSKPVASTTAEGPPPATSSRRRRRPLAEPQPIAVEEPPRRGWLSVAVAIAVVIALALLFAAR